MFTIHILFCSVHHNHRGFIDDNNTIVAKGLLNLSLKRTNKTYQSEPFFDTVEAIDSL